MYDGNHFAYYIALAIQTSACLLLILNVRGIYKGSRRAIIYAFISIILIASATIYLCVIFIIVMAHIIFVLLILAYQRAQVLKRPLRFKKLAFMLLLSIFILYLNHILISGTLYALDVYHIEIDTSLLRYYFWMTIVIIMLLVGVIAWLLTISINALIIALI